MGVKWSERPRAIDGRSSVRSLAWRSLPFVAFQYAFYGSTF
jgi:hypothetical protein